MLLWRLLATNIHLPGSRSAVLQRTYARFFQGQKFQKLFKSLTVGQAVPEIPLTVGSKLELLSLPNVRILTRTLTHLSAYAYCRVYIHIIHDRGFCTLVPYEPLQ